MEIPQSSSNGGASSSIEQRERDDAEELQWAAIERLPTYRRSRVSLLLKHGNSSDDNDEKRSIVDVSKLEAMERRLLIEKLVRHIEDDNRRLLQNIKQRIDRVNLKFPTIEVRYKNLCVEATCEVVDGKPLPTLWNATKSLFKGITRMCRIFGCASSEAKIRIIKGASGIIKPSRMTLLLGPPGCGKTTFLLALAGNLNKSLKATGEITYNGFSMEEFVPEKTSAYISQYDLHIPDMTVRETLDFSARYQGVGSRAEIMMELSRREKEAGIVPDPDIDTYMKAISVEGLQRTLQTDYIMKILGLDICSDIMVGDAMRRGISGGQKKRLTTGEMIVGPTRALFMDEISTGLDSSTTFQIVSFLRQLVHITEVTALVSLLQPAPETFDLFDDIILMAEGKIIYHGPRIQVLEFFQECGFKCPERKGVSDFLQEVISRKDQAQYWCHADKPYTYVTADQFRKRFKESPIGRKLEEDLSKDYDKSRSHKNALSFTSYSLTKWDLFKACMAREVLLMKRNLFIYAFRIGQLTVVALITMTVFLRTQMEVDLVHTVYYMAALFYTLIRLMTNGVQDLVLTIYRLPVFFKQKGFLFYPAWAYSIPVFILSIPFSLAESFIWTAITYYGIGYSPEAERFFRQFFLLFALHQASTSLFRFIGAIVQETIVGFVIGSLAILISILFGGFIIPRPSLPSWLRWGFWISPITYAEIGISINEFHAPRWQKISSANMTIGEVVLKRSGLNFKGYFYWVSVAALFGFAVLFNIGFALALTYLKPLGSSRIIISRDKISQLQEQEDHDSEECVGNSLISMTPTTTEQPNAGRMVLPFQPFTVVFHDVQYFIDTPQEMKEEGFMEKRLQLLSNITGAFRPGILTALMGVSGAGKTTLMDVLCGRKTSGTIEGDIRIGGYPKIQETFARISGYCEQTDIHSPHITVEESVIYSAWLRLPSQIDPATRAEFVKEVLETIELDVIKDSLVGIPGLNGLSTEQRKRLTIAVELVANPSIIFMDEPTSGLDARAAAIVMRAVKNVVNTGRTVVCTIHQPSIDIFETFDEMILMKRGGQIIYSGLLGQNSTKLIEYFEGIPGVPKIRDNYNPATWVLEVTSSSMELQLGVDFAHLYRESLLYRNNEEMVKQLSSPPTGSTDLHFSTRFPQSGWEQFKACLWKQHLSYWRNPAYNLMRIIFMIISSILFGAVFWQHGRKIHDDQSVFDIAGSMFISMIFLGLNNCTSVLTFVDRERTVFYRERFAGMYSSLSYSSAQVIIEIPYMLLLTTVFVTITYPAIGYHWSLYKVFWYFYAMLSTLLYFNYLGMFVMSVTPNVQVASVLVTASYTLLNLFSGFLIPKPQIPKWWIWCYWISPTSWTLNGFLTSQYGDIHKEITAFGKQVPVSAFLKDFYGFHHGRLAVVAVILAAYPIVFASLFTYCIGKLNFQRR
ncbi:Pleiotropic drug resistance protein 3 [Acorus calamus]|uniref:Pleiotropic drug resistance protein 3 n=1 Tax=Acorus calamus TaxID=4465 RepID=A0AAV9D560_ACOCL|nr:Pleiotropic drug resistance protein 3 [Acorus calamus]